MTPSTLPFNRGIAVTLQRESREMWAAKYIGICLVKQYIAWLLTEWESLTRLNVANNAGRQNGTVLRFIRLQTLKWENFRPRSDYRQEILLHPLLQDRTTVDALPRETGRRSALINYLFDLLLHFFRSSMNLYLLNGQIWIHIRDGVDRVSQRLQRRSPPWNSERRKSHLYC